MSKLILKQVTVHPDWQMNCYVLICPETKHAALIDPGAEFEKIAAMVGRAQVRKILLTHSDIDHIGALAEAREKYRVPVYLHPNDVERTGRDGSIRRVEETRPLKEGMTVRIGNHSVKTYEVFGHSPGHVVFRFDSRAIVGDTIFPGGPGHTRTPEQ